MMPFPQTLFDQVIARLPLFDDLPEEAVDRLTVSGFGRGLLTAAIRARLRKAGFADMGMLALATPIDLMAVRKIGPVRVDAIRVHVLGELARFIPGVRAAHDKDATDRRRLDRLRALPVGWPPLDGALTERFGTAGLTWADLALMRHKEAAQVLGISTADLDGIASALVRTLVPDTPRAMPAAALHGDDAAQDARATRAYTELLRERDREWDEAAPERGTKQARAT